MTGECAGDRMLSLKEMVAQSGMSASYFYCNKSWGSLGLNVQKIGGRLRCRESDFSEWLKLRPLVEATRPDVLVKDLLAVVEGIGESEILSPGEHGDVLNLFVERLERVLRDIATRIRLDKSVPYSEYLEKFTAIVKQIEDGFMGNLPIGARLFFALAFSGPVSMVHTDLFNFVKEEFRIFFRGHIRAMLGAIGAREWQTNDEKLEAAGFYLPEDVWEASGFSAEEKAGMLSEVFAAHGGVVGGVG